MKRFAYWFGCCVLPAALSTLACDSGKQSRAGSGGSDGSGGSGDAGGSGGGAGGGAGGGSGTMVACGPEPPGGGVLVPAALANPSDFSVNAQTGATDQHTLVILRRDVFDRVTSYMTGGSADHQHEIVLTTQQVGGFQANQSTTAVTGPPLGVADGHTHTVMIRACGFPGN